MGRSRGWKYESARHSLAARGIATRYDAAKSFLGQFVENTQLRKKALQKRDVEEAGLQQKTAASVYERSLATDLTADEREELKRLDEKLRRRHAGVSLELKKNSKNAKKVVDPETRERYEEERKGK